MLDVTFVELVTETDFEQIHRHAAHFARKRGARALDQAFRQRSTVAPDNLSKVR
jgi:hypothetical protein